MLNTINEFLQLRKRNSQFIVARWCWNTTVRIHDNMIKEVNGLFVILDRKSLIVSMVSPQVFWVGVCGCKTIDVLRDFTIPPCICVGDHNTLK